MICDMPNNMHGIFKQKLNSYNTTATEKPVKYILKRKVDSYYMVYHAVETDKYLNIKYTYIINYLDNEVVHAVCGII